MPVMERGSPDMATRNDRYDANRRNAGKYLWSDLSQRATDEINIEVDTTERLRESRRQAREGHVFWEDSATE